MVNWSLYLVCDPLCDDQHIDDENWEQRYVNSVLTKLMFTHPVEFLTMMVDGQPLLSRNVRRTAFDKLQHDFIVCYW